MARNVPGDASQASEAPRRRRTRGMPPADQPFAITFAPVVDEAADERDLTAVADWLMERRAARLTRAGAAGVAP